MWYLRNFTSYRCCDSQDSVTARIESITPVAMHNLWMEATMPDKKQRVKVETISYAFLRLKDRSWPCRIASYIYNGVPHDYVYDLSPDFYELYETQSQPGSLDSADAVQFVDLDMERLLKSDIKDKH